MTAPLHIDIAGQVGTFMLEATFEAGEGTTAVFGPSGAGKTTLLRMIAGLERPLRGVIRAGGTVFFDSERGVDLAAHRRRIGYVFQESRLFPHMTVRSNLTYAPAAKGPDTASRLDAIVELMGIAPLLERRSARLSGGEKQRVAIGRALLSEPALLLLDEPLASLDRARRREIIPYLERVREQAGIPIVFVSHDLDDVARLADTLVVMREGRVAASGPAREVFAGDTLGDLAGGEEAGALLEGQVAQVDADYGIARIDVGGSHVELALPQAVPGEEVRLRIRARDVGIALRRLEGVSIRNQIEARVVETSGQRGAHADIVLETGSQRLLARITRRSLDELNLKPGDVVYALLKAVAVERQPAEE